MATKGAVPATAPGVQWLTCGNTTPPVRVHVPDVSLDPNFRRLWIRFRDVDIVDTEPGDTLGFGQKGEGEDGMPPWGSL